MTCLGGHVYGVKTCDPTSSEKSSRMGGASQSGFLLFPLHPSALSKFSLTFNNKCVIYISNWNVFINIKYSEIIEKYSHQVFLNINSSNYIGYIYNLFSMLDMSEHFFLSTALATLKIEIACWVSYSKLLRGLIVLKCSASLTPHQPEGGWKETKSKIIIKNNKQNRNLSGNFLPDRKPNNHSSVLRVSKYTAAAFLYRNKFKYQMRRNVKTIFTSVISKPVKVAINPL